MFAQKQSLIASDNCINANFKNVAAQYTVMITIQQEGEEEQVVSYNAQVQYTKDTRDPYYLVAVTISDFLLNLSIPETMLQEMALACQKAIEKCVFSVDNNHKIIDLHNHSEILTRWKTIKTQLYQDNEGETFEQYVALFEKSLLDKQVLLQKLKKDTFIKQYFFHIFEEPYHGFERKGIERFSFFDVDYEEEMVLRVGNEGIFDDSATVQLTKAIVQSDKNTSLFPIEAYETYYTFNTHHEIQEIQGAFKNHGKAYLFEITLIEKK
jgi:hypothetical protein